MTHSYMRDAKDNLQTLAIGGTDDFLVMANNEVMDVVPAWEVYHHSLIRYTWLQADLPPDTRTFAISITSRDEGHIVGNLYSIDLALTQNSIRKYTPDFTHVDIVLEGGENITLTAEQWQEADEHIITPIMSSEYRYDPADEDRLTTYLDAIRWTREDCGKAVTAAEFIAAVNATYMAQTNSPQHNMLRVAPDAAKEILAQNAAHVFWISLDGTKRLTPVDAAKAGMWPKGREFGVMRSDLAGLEKWARRASADILRQAERNAPDRSKNKGTEL